MKKDSSSNTLISIIIPFYNSAEYLSKCVESVIMQTYKNLEIIMVDDGSTDKSVELVAGYIKEDARIRLIRQNNRGAGAARNIGLKEAKGDFIGFVDSDDWIEPDMYEYLHTLITEREADIAACDYILTKNREEINKDTLSEKIRLMNQSQLFEFFFRIHGEKSYYSVCNMLYRAETIKKNRFPEGKITEDLLFNYMAYKNCRQYVFSNQKKYFYYSNPTGVTRRKLGKTDLALLENWDFILKDIKMFYPEMEKYAMLNRWRADFTLLSKAFLYGYDGQEVSKEVIYSMKTALKTHKKYLIKGNMLDWKRKILLFVCCYK